MTVRVTRAAEGLSRRAFTIADVERMREVGLIGPDERFELIGGEIVPMVSPKGIRHERMKTWLVRELARKLPEAFEFTPETTVRLSPDTFVEPDFVVYRKADGLDGITGERILLAIEVSDATVPYDTGPKADLFSRFRVPELWVMDVRRPRVVVHRDPGPSAYATVYDWPVDRPIEPRAIPSLSIRFSDFQDFA